MERLVMVRYEVKPDRVEENEELVRAVYAELAATELPGLSYMTFALEDGVGFVHVARTDGDGENPLGAVAAFARFQEGLGDRLVAPPTVTSMRQVGGYRVFGA